MLDAERSSAVSSRRAQIAVHRHTRTYPYLPLGASHSGPPGPWLPNAEVLGGAPTGFSGDATSGPIERRSPRRIRPRPYGSAYSQSPVFTRSSQMPFALHPQRWTGIANPVQRHQGVIQTRACVEPAERVRQCEGVPDEGFKLGASIGGVGVHPLALRRYGANRCGERARMGLSHGGCDARWRNS
jgi:hypothetical protein